MTPLWGTKTPSAPIGDRSAGDGRAARSLLSGALWRAMGGYGAAWAATVPRAANTAFPVHQTSDISSGANQAPQPWFSRNTRHETRITASLPTISHHFPPFPTISRHFPAPPTPPSADQVSTRRPPFLVSRPGLPPPPGRCFPAPCGAAWGGYGAASAAWGAPSRCPRTVRAGNRAIRVFTKHETRDKALAWREAQAGANSEVFTKHETRITNHGLFTVSAGPQASRGVMRSGA